MTAYECEFLEDSLRRYGVYAEYWPSSAGAEPAPLTLCMEDAALASPNWRDELDEVVGSRDHLPLFVGLGDVRLKTGLTDAALKAYAFAVSDEIELMALCELGSLLINRCRTDERPLSDRDIDGWTVNFDGRNDLAIVSLAPHRAAQEPLELPDSAPVLRLSVNAFGRAYVLAASSHFNADGPTTADLWCQLLALEGLRVGFMELDDVPALQATVAGFFGWMEDYCRPESEFWQGRKWLTVLANQLAKSKGATLSRLEEEDHDDGWDLDQQDTVYRFLRRFRHTESYLRGRRKVATAPAMGDAHTTALALGEMTGLLRASDRRMDNLVEKVIDIEQRVNLTLGAVSQLAGVEPPAERAYVEELRLGLAAVWESLDPQTRAELVDAEIRVADCQRTGSGWRDVALNYANAIERELKITLDRMRQEVFHVTAGGTSETLGQLIHSLGDYSKVDRKLLSPNAISLVWDGYDSLLFELNDIRKRIHPPRKPVDRHAGQRAKSLVLDPQGGHDKALLVAIVEARQPTKEDA